MNNYLSVAGLCDTLDKEMKIMSKICNKFIIFDDFNNFHYLFIVSLSPVINVFLSSEFINIFN